MLRDGESVCAVCAHMHTRTCVRTCILDGEGNRASASRALVVVSTDGSVSDQLH